MWTCKSCGWMNTKGAKRCANCSTRIGSPVTNVAVIVNRIPLTKGSPQVAGHRSKSMMKASYKAAQIVQLYPDGTPWVI